MPTTHCIECDEVIELEGRVRIGQQITCEHCGADLEVVGIDPLELNWAEEDDAEAWDDEFEDDLEEELDDVLLIEDDPDEDELDEDDLDEDELDEDELDEDEDELDDDFEDDFEDDDFAYDDEDEYVEDDEEDRRWR